MTKMLESDKIEHHVKGKTMSKNDPGSVLDEEICKLVEKCLEMYKILKEEQKKQRNFYEMTPEEAEQQLREIRKNRLFLNRIQDLHLDNLTDKASILVFYNGICFDRLDDQLEDSCCAEFFVHEKDFIADVVKHISRYGNRDVVEKAQSLW